MWNMQEFQRWLRRGRLTPAAWQEVVLRVVPHDTLEGFAWHLSNVALEAVRRASTADATELAYVGQRLGDDLTARLKQDSWERLDFTASADDLSDLASCVSEWGGDWHWPEDLALDPLRPRALVTALRADTLFATWVADFRRVALSCLRALRTGRSVGVELWEGLEILVEWAEALECFPIKPAATQLELPLDEPPPPRAPAATETTPPDGVKPPTLEELEKTTPALDTGNSQWRTNKDTAEHEGVGVASLAAYRRQGRQTRDHMFGQDKNGRLWRRRGTVKSHPWYWVETLLKNSSKPGKKPNFANHRGN